MKTIEQRILNLIPNNEQKYWLMLKQFEGKTLTEDEHRFLIWLAELDEWTVEQFLGLIQKTALKNN